MAARLCCGIRYPATEGPCPVCGEPADYRPGEQPDDDWENAVAVKRATARPAAARQVIEWRRDQLARLGFDGVTLDLLADSDVNVHVAYDLVARGCSLSLAAAILL